MSKGHIIEYEEERVALPDEFFRQLTKVMLNALYQRSEKNGPLLDKEFVRKTINDLRNSNMVNGQSSLIPDLLFEKMERDKNSEYNFYYKLSRVSYRFIEFVEVRSDVFSRVYTSYPHFNDAHLPRNIRHIKRKDVYLFENNLTPLMYKAAVPHLKTILHYIENPEADINKLVSRGSVWGYQNILITGLVSMARGDKNYLISPLIHGIPKEELEKTGISQFELDFFTKYCRHYFMSYLNETIERAGDTPSPYLELADDEHKQDSRAGWVIPASHRQGAQAVQDQAAEPFAANAQAQSNRAAAKGLIANYWFRMTLAIAKWWQPNPYESYPKVKLDDELFEIAKQPISDLASSQTKHTRIMEKLKLGANPLARDKQGRTILRNIELSTKVTIMEWIWSYILKDEQKFELYYKFKHFKEAYKVAVEREGILERISPMQEAFRIFNNARATAQPTPITYDRDALEDANLYAYHHTSLKDWLLSFVKRVEPYASAKFYQVQEKRVEAASSNQIVLDANGKPAEEYVPSFSEKLACTSHRLNLDYVEKVTNPICNLFAGNSR